MSSEPVGPSVDEPDRDGAESPVEDLLEPIFDDEEQTRIEAAAGARAESLEQFLREGVLFLTADTLGDGGHLDCWAEDCERTFATERRCRGHFGSAHEQDRPDDDFWCRVCGYGPTTSAGVACHHGHRHTGEDVRPLDHEPDQDELLDPDDVPDHMDPELLAELYDEHEGNVAAMCRAHDFDVSYGRVSHYLEQFGIHERTPNSPQGTTDGPDHRNPELLRAPFERHDGVIARAAEEFAVTAQTVRNYLIEHDIYDPDEPRASDSAPSKDEEDDGPDPLDVDDPEDLELAYEATDSIAAATELFPDATYGVVRQHLIDHGIHVPADRGEQSEEPELEQPGEPETEADDDPEPSVDVGPPETWGFEAGFQTIDEQQDTGGDRLVEDAHCVRCGDPYDGEGLCDYCADGLETELVTDGGEILACPECDRSDIERRNGRDGRAEPGTYRCKDCRARFDVPERRPPKIDPGPRPLGPIGRALIEADPDDVPGGGS